MPDDAHSYRGSVTLATSMVDGNGQGKCQIWEDRVPGIQASPTHCFARAGVAVGAVEGQPDRAIVQPLRGPPLDGAGPNANKGCLGSEEFAGCAEQ